MALLMIGAGVLMPPIAGISLVDAQVFGVPVTLAYVFSVWAFLILSAALLARPLLDSAELVETAEQEPTRD